MMIPIGLILGFLTGALSWQINLISIHRGLKNSRHAAFLTGFGATLADMGLIFVALAGLAYLLKSPDMMILIKAVSMLVILIIAANMFFQKPTRTATNTLKKKHLKRSLLAGFVLVAGNPGMLLLWMSAMTFLAANFHEFQLLYSRLLFFAGFLLGSLGWYWLLAYIFLEKIHAQNHEDRKLILISRISAIFILVAGVAVLIKG